MAAVFALVFSEHESVLFSRPHTNMAIIRLLGSSVVIWIRLRFRCISGVPRLKHNQLLLAFLIHRVVNCHTFVAASYVLYAS